MARNCKFDVPSHGFDATSWQFFVLIRKADLTLWVFPKQVPSERETVWEKDEDRQMSSSSLLICTSTALLINVSMSVKQRDCTLFCKVM